MVRSPGAFRGGSQQVLSVTSRIALHLFPFRLGCEEHGRAKPRLHRCLSVRRPPGESGDHGLVASG